MKESELGELKCLKKPTSTAITDGSFRAESAGTMATLEGMSKVGSAILES
jgi:hypothetical protein